MQVMSRAILIVGTATVIVDGRTALYKPASGVVFGHNKLGYVITLAVIFTFGVAAIFAGIWISMFGLTYRRGFWIAGIVLFLSIWPLIGILSIGGLA